MGETRVNLRHLLEDIRDSYPFPEEEAIITELIANSLDSNASRIGFFINALKKTFSIVDNGLGMAKNALESFHDIAATTKTRGKGIGFAAVGVKLSLLIADVVVTETKFGGYHGATEWKMESAKKAPWQYIEPPGLVTTPSGTAVSIIVSDNNSMLLIPQLVQGIICKHFYPILDCAFMNDILKHVYRKGVEFHVNGKKLELTTCASDVPKSPFIVKTGRRDKPIGIGFLSKGKEDYSEDERGIAISAYGKIIKRGWDWVGICPNNPASLSGIVEIPQLSEILITNKSDFLKDATSLQKYYKVRKAIQEAIEPVLKHYGELGTKREKPEKSIRPLEKEIEKALALMLNEFPELGPLLGRHRQSEVAPAVLPEANGSSVGTLYEEPGAIAPTGSDIGGARSANAENIPPPDEYIDKTKEPVEPGNERESRKRSPGLMLGFQDDPNREELGWLLENYLWINKGHPLYRKYADSPTENYHIVLAVAWVLSGYLEGGKSPQMFINRFLYNWGRGS